MKKTPYILLILCVAAIVACGRKESEPVQYIRAENGRFMIGDSVVAPYAGMNMWYAAILASEGRGGDRARLARELDTLQAIGVNNLRVLAGGDGPEGMVSHISPVLQERAGVYNDTLLQGLDYLLAELEKRGMTAVLYLNNAWEWSGGYGSYLEWAGAGRAPVPAVDGWPAYMQFVPQFLQNDSAKALFADHVRKIVGRTNSITGRPYAESPAIMSWQVANEPRAFSEENKPRLVAWIDSTAKLIKSLDPNHMVSVGSEGSHGCEEDIELWAELHRIPEIDYATIHIWPYNWGWSGDSAAIKATEYIDAHAAIARRLGKPLVLEEFGAPRDSTSLLGGAPAAYRDGFYRAMMSLCRPDGPIQGLNIWGWGGYAVPVHESWQPGDPYTGDPAQEPQGWNSVFVNDTSTIRIIRDYNIK